MGVGGVGGGGARDEHRLKGEGQNEVGEEGAQKWRDEKRILEITSNPLTPES